ncbi:MAG: S1/P1 nuclease [Acidobacteriota bacterium]|nr:S1/P1 nuclease [Acidobacteriota bacterium]
MKRNSFGKILLAFCLLYTTPAYCWWETGHRTVARLAAIHLTPAARTHLAAILNVQDTPEAVADALSVASTWADETRSQTKTGEWHYIDLALQDDKSDIPERCKDDNCVTARIRLFAAQLSRHDSSGPISDLDALRYLVHFVGDIHQPLHAVSDADLGGNCEHVDPPVDTAKNLHALWDGAIVNAVNPSDRELAADLERNLQSFSEQLRADLALGNQDDWAWESHKLAIKNIYQKLSIPTEPVIFPANCQAAPLAISNLELRLPSSYIDDMKPVVREQLTKAGLRLARVLNESL